jgi:hypothetical protein
MVLHEGGDGASKGGRADEGGKAEKEVAVGMAEMSVSGFTLGGGENNGGDANHGCLMHELTGTTDEEVSIEHSLSDTRAGVEDWFIPEDSDFSGDTRGEAPSIGTSEHDEDFVAPRTMEVGGKTQELRAKEGVVGAMETVGSGGRNEGIDDQVSVMSAGAGVLEGDDLGVKRPTQDVGRVGVAKVIDDKVGVTRES